MSGSWGLDLDEAKRDIDIHEIECLMPSTAPHSCNVKNCDFL